MQHVLVVQNHDSLAWALQDGLERLPNCSVTVAQRGDQAIKLLQSRPFDLLITDYRMPGMDGITLAEKVHQLYPEMATIILTTYVSDRLCEQAARMAIRCVLEKPVRLAELRRAALEALGGQCPSSGARTDREEGSRECQPHLP